MAFECFELSLEGGVAHLRLSRPEKLNSMIPAFWRELPEAIGALDQQGDARVIVLSSTGKHFTSGMDLAVLASHQDDPKLEIGRKRLMLRESVLRLQRSFSALEQSRMPVIAAIQGGCIGGGVDMVTACDMRYATEDAFFSIHEINLGMTADVGTLQRLPKLIPSGIVREMAYAGRRLPAKRALEVGLVNAVFPDQQAMLDHVMELAREIASKSPLAIHGTKEMLNYARDHSVEDALNYIATWQAGMFFPTDIVEGVMAQQQKRQAEFQDLPARSANSFGI